MNTVIANILNRAVDLRKSYTLKLIRIIERVDAKLTLYVYNYTYWTQK